MLRLLDVGIDLDQGIAEWIQGNPGEDAIVTLEKALARWQQPIDKKRDFGGIGAESCREDTILALRAALAACRGEKFDEEKERRRMLEASEPPRKPPVPDRGRR